MVKHCVRLVLLMLIALATPALAQQSQDMVLERLSQCQSQLRVKQELLSSAEQVAASQLTRAERAEEQAKSLQKKLEELPKEKKD